MKNFVTKFVAKWLWTPYWLPGLFVATMTIVGLIGLIIKHT